MTRHRHSIVDVIIIVIVVVFIQVSVILTTVIILNTDIILLTHLLVVVMVILALMIPCYLLQVQLYYTKKNIVTPVPDKSNPGNLTLK